MIKNTLEYEDKELYVKLLETALRMGYDTFAIVFIGRDEHRVVQPAKGLDKYQQKQLDEVIEAT